MWNEPKCQRYIENIMEREEKPNILSDGVWKQI